jgi:hypothetical protein
MGDHTYEINKTLDDINYTLKDSSKSLSEIKTYLKFSNEILYIWTRFFIDMQYDKNKDKSQTSTFMGAYRKLEKISEELEKNGVYTNG